MFRLSYQEVEEIIILRVKEMEIPMCLALALQNALLENDYYRGGYSLNR